jgi:hypothetical protein
MKIILLLGFLILQISFNIQALAANQLVTSGETYKVLPGSSTQDLIDRAVEDTFRSPMKNDLCAVYQHPQILAYSVGVTAGAAEKIYRDCPRSNNSALRMPKIFQKQYFIVQDSKNSQKIQSWTSQDNKTFIFLDPNMDYAEFKNVIAHEMAIALDAKANMLLTTYYMYEGASGGSSANKNLRAAFNASTFHAISLTFVTLRALQFEELIKENGSQSNLDHATCSRRFFEIFKLFQDRPDLFKEDTNSLYGDFNEILSLSNTPSDIYQTLNFILSPSLKMPKSRGLTFCQYMSSPLFTNKTAFSFSSGGPRPRVGGGWEPKPNSQEKLEKIFQAEIKNKKLIKIDPKSVNLDLKSLATGGF